MTRYYCKSKSKGQRAKSHSATVERRTLHSDVLRGVLGTTVPAAACRTSHTIELWAAFFAIQPLFPRSRYLTAKREECAFDTIHEELVVNDGFCGVPRGVHRGREAILLDTYCINKQY